MKKKFKVDKWFKYKAALLVLSIFGFGFLLWYSYYIHVDNSREEEVPIIRAPLNIISRPQNPGGMIVPNKDKDIYNRMLGRKGGSERASSTGLSESNLSKSEALTLIDNQLNNERKKKASRRAKNVINAQISPKLYYLRVAKLTDASVGSQALKILQKSYPILKDLGGKLYEQKDSNGQKKYYLHVGPIKERNAAEKLCAKLTESGKACKIFAE